MSQYNITISDEILHGFLSQGCSQAFVGTFLVQCNLKAFSYFLGLLA
ncbi:hypothetical protein [Caenibacillus caldisaponilyticus]|nr:hypothetical protein [Caenibacillus caldisaponilyticus]